MEGWQKGAAAVLRLSSAGKERYFNRFPERKAWFETNHPEHFGRSAAVATTSLKNVTKAKQQKQRLAAIRQAAEKRDQSMVLSPERRLMAQRRREGGEGLGGGLETEREVLRFARDSIRTGNYIKSGGLGSLFEADGAIVKKGDKWVFNGVAYDSLKDAQNAKEGAYDFQRKVTDTSVSGNREKMFNTLSSIGQNMVDIGTNVVLPMATGQIGAGIEGLKTLSSRLYGTSWPSAGEGGRWEASMRQQGRPVYTSEVDLDAHLRKASPGAGPQKDEEGNLIIPKRIPFSKTVQVGDVPRNKGEMYFTGRNMEEKLYEDEDEKSMREEDNLAKEFAQKIIEEKRLQECMPMAMMIKSKSSEDDDNKWDYMDTWEKNPIKKGSTSSEAEDEPGEYDYEGDMAKSQLRSIMHNSKMLHDMLEDKTNLPEWVQSKITLAEDYILTAANYMRGELMSEEVEQIDESDKVAKNIARSMIAGKGKESGLKVSTMNADESGAKGHQGKVHFVHHKDDEGEGDYIAVSHHKGKYVVSHTLSGSAGEEKPTKHFENPDRAIAYGRKILGEEVEQIDEAFDKSSPAHAKAKELVSNYGNRSAVRAVYHGDGTATIYTTGNKKVSSATRVDHIHDQAGLGYNRSAEAYRNLSKSKGGLKFKTIETEGKSIYGSHKIRISNKGMNEEVEQIDEGATRWEYSGTVNGKTYTVTIPRGADLSDHLDLEKIQSENPHLEPHEVKAVADTSGEYEDHVEVEHEGEKYTHYVTNNEEPRMIYMDEEVEYNDDEAEDVGAVHSSMEREMDKDLPFDPTGERKPGDVIDKSGAVHTQMSRVRHLAQMALQAGIPQPKMPLEGEEGHAQIRAEHEAQTGASEQIAEGAAARRKSKSDDLIKRSMLPDRSVIPTGKGFGDDLKRKKIMKKVYKVLQKKKMTLPTDDPYANELVPQSMLPDVPGYPEGYQMEEQVVEQSIEHPVEQQVETPVVEENASPFVSAGSKFLTRTSARLVYGDKNDQE